MRTVLMIAALLLAGANSAQGGHTDGWCLVASSDARAGDCLINDDLMDKAVYAPEAFDKLSGCPIEDNPCIINHLREMTGGKWRIRRGEDTTTAD